MRMKVMQGGMKSFILILSLAICLTSGFTAMAEETAAEEEVNMSYVGYLDAALDATALMTAKAITDDIYLSEGDGGWDFRTVPFASPQLALLFFPTQEQQEQISHAFGSNSVTVIKPMADAVNSQFSADYAKLAEELYTEGSFNYTAADGIAKAIILLFYDRHISITMIDSTQDIPQYGAEFLMSDATVLPTVDESYLPQRLSEMGLTGDFNQVFYDPGQMDAIFEEQGYQSNVSSVIEAITASDDTYLQMAKELLNGPAYEHNTYISADELANGYSISHAEEYSNKFDLIKAVRDLNEQAMGDVDGWTWNGVSITAEPYSGKIPTETEDFAYQPDKKILVVTHEEGDEGGEISYSIESILPTENFPTTPEEADQIIYIDTFWDYSDTNNGIKIYDSKSTIALYDAKTMEKIGDIGSAFKTLSGFVMVSGDSYYAPVNWTDIKEQIKDWIGAGEAETEE